ncbi:MAG: MBL fold metallo-hydrolase [Sarcina sp.]
MKFTKIDIDNCYSYLIVSSKSSGILIDPKLDYCSVYLNIIKEHNINLKLIIDTHTHADHLSGAGYLKGRTSAKYAMYEKAKAKNVDIKLKDLEEFKVDELEFKVIHTPGHTDDSMSIICEDKLFTGDFLFLDGIGRDDLETGSSETHFKTLKKIHELNDYLVVCPAHNYGQHELSSLYQVKKENPILKCKTIDEFVKETKPEKEAPEWMNDVVKLNNEGNTDFDSIKVKKDEGVCQKGSGNGSFLENIGYITKNELKDTMKMKLNTVILDVRQEEEFKELKPIEGSIFIPIEELPNRLEELQQYIGRTFVTVCRSGVRAMKAAKIIKMSNIGNAFVLKGGIIKYREEI